ncbi:DMT family transporter [Streptomyces alkaliterrae]|uniref:DMT family transporter n=5 Tax=Streptomyces alkaliterrae TaxID=2213162 RepID=A0A7W3X0P4_9ACTN|nr:DMT family transporter [Streptomyces alkaliterrae]MBB1261862.1 DMT family transporter [Streptomyces alkaliterrae]
MRHKDSATATISIAVPAGSGAETTARTGTVLAAAGVVAFSLTFPATAWALDGLSAWTATALRIGLAGVVAAVALLVLRVAPPARRHWGGLAVVAGGVVVGFPLLTALALETSSTAHAAVVVGLLPLTTAAYGAWRRGTRHPAAFWLAASGGAVLVAGFALWESGGGLSPADLLLFGALVVCAAGYGEGGRLAEEMPGWQVIGWALALCLPLSLPVAVLAMAVEPDGRLTARTVVGLAWLVLGSQCVGLMVWYRGMAVIGVGRASQLQLAQPLLTLLWAVLLLGERMSPLAPLTALGVLACIAVTQRTAGGGAGPTVVRVRRLGSGGQRS